MCHAVAMLVVSEKKNKNKKKEENKGKKQKQKYTANGVGSGKKKGGGVTHCVDVLCHVTAGAHTITPCSA
jgi:hypothetical protein